MVKDTKFSPNDLEAIRHYVSELVKVDELKNEKYFNEVGLTIAKLGDKGREFFFEISVKSDRSDLGQNDLMFDKLLHEQGGQVDVKSFFEDCVEHFGLLQYDSSKSRNGVEGIVEKDEVKELTQAVDKQIKEDQVTRYDSLALSGVKLQKAINNANPSVPLDESYVPFAYRGEVGLLAGTRNSGKSIWLLQHAVRLSKKGIKVLFVDWEMTLAQMKARNPNFESIPNLYYLNKEQFNSRKIATDQLVPKIKEIMQTEDIEWLIVDNISAIENYADTTRANKAQETIDKILRLKYLKTQPAITIVSHLTKMSNKGKPQPVYADHIRGSGMYLDLVDGAFIINKAVVKDDHDTYRVYIKQVKVFRGTLDYVYHEDKCLVLDEVRPKGAARYFREARDVHGEDRSESALTNYNQEPSKNEINALIAQREAEIISNIQANAKKLNWNPTNKSLAIVLDMSERTIANRKELLKNQNR